MTRLLSGIIGLAIADALGVPAEFQSRLTLEEHPIEDMQDGGSWNQPKGTWSDDTAMTLATIDALGKNDWKVTDKCLLDIMKNFSEWYLDGKYAVGGNRFDIGNTCRDAIVTYINLKDNYLKELKKTRANEKYGNGALMRILPCAFLQNVEDIRKISSLTHNNFVCDVASEYYVAFIRGLMHGYSKDIVYTNNTICLENTLKEGTKDEQKRFSRLADLSFNKMDRSKIRSSGYVIDTLEAAVWCFMNTNNYKDCVLTAVNLGEDTDTVAAVAGGLAGVYYGYDGLPKEWLKQLRDIEVLLDIVKNSCDSYYNGKENKDEV